MKRRPTSFDIAQAAGVSQPTVSRALRGSGLVKEQTRKRILAIAERLNYRVDKNASSLRRQASNTLALLLFEDQTSDGSRINPFFLTMLASIMRCSARYGYDLLVSFQHLSNDWHTEYQDSHRADGLILLGYGDYQNFHARLEQLDRQQTHFVRWGAVDPHTPGLTLGSDNFGGGRQATHHLLGLGRRNIAFLGNASPDAPEFAARFEGHVAALREAGLRCDLRLRHDALSTESDGYAAAMALIESKMAFDGIVAASDLIAIGALRALADAGLSVPGDVSLTGFDDIPAASLTAPPLTTIAQDALSAGEALVDAIVARIHGETRPSRELPVNLVVRRSCGAK